MGRTPRVKYLHKFWGNRKPAMAFEEHTAEKKEEAIEDTEMEMGFYI